MAITTILRSTGGVDDVRALMGRSTLRRKLSVGTSWTKLRVGLRLCIEDTGGNVLSTPQFAVGLCSGTTNPFNDGSAITTHWVGAITAGASWTRASNAFGVGYGVTWLVPAKRIGMTFTYGTALSAGIFNSAALGFAADANGVNRGLFFVDITKGNPNFTFNGFIRASTVGAAAPADRDVSYDEFIEQLELPVPSITGHQDGTARTMAVDEATHGYLDTVNIFWNRSTPRFEISDIAAVRLA